MSFRDNLLHLRASNNMTQEQLAMMLGVSRQSVTKWESERSYPELDKLCKMCEIFDCTLDELVQGDLTGKAPTRQQPGGAAPVREDVFGYDDFMTNFAGKISRGVMDIVLGVAFGCALFALSEPENGLGFVLPENMGAAFGFLCIAAGIVVGLIDIVSVSLAHARFVRQHPFIEDFYTDRQKEEKQKTFVRELIGGIAIIAVGIVVLLLTDGTRWEELVGTVGILVCIAVGARFIVHGGMTIGLANIDDYNESAAETLTASEIESLPMPEDRRRVMMQQHKTDKLIGAVCGIIMLVATVVGLVLLFVPLGAQGSFGRANEFFWLSWAVGGVCCGIATLAIRAFVKPKSE
ncbi:helix-turn-helix transcriptional regulator [Xiamenia xianingshaonis]|uniref:Helix-turn-helix domain-containing protein n=1 Tax=Xiamenia xianingshaonis TaxID=2682776 RepID=A0A9E6SU65_9ACTN|nr:helix-turn-helix transcriptional regulator [Xiamenia xianingshaonis]NGM16857.1 helix-turn-helix domain-containing protein [Eggerthellaceae bacterium zg-893]NHM14249.1 helix-turn-helix domain-containing protein [Xiamenia xianingshaonis]QTU84141.1 helix-turn-helix transcriptional regulator [Xiamenia xianingshaonis]